MKTSKVVGGVFLGLMLGAGGGWVYLAHEFDKHANAMIEKVKAVPFVKFDDAQVHKFLFRVDINNLRITTESLPKELKSQLVKNTPKFEASTTYKGITRICYVPFQRKSYLTPPETFEMQWNDTKMAFHQKGSGHWVMEHGDPKAFMAPSLIESLLAGAIHKVGYVMKDGEITNESGQTLIKGSTEFNVGFNNQNGQVDFNVTSMSHNLDVSGLVNLKLPISDLPVDAGIIFKPFALSGVTNGHFDFSFKLDLDKAKKMFEKTAGKLPENPADLLKDLPSASLNINLQSKNDLGEDDFKFGVSLDPKDSSVKFMLDGNVRYKEKIREYLKIVLIPAFEAFAKAEQNVKNLSSEHIQRIVDLLATAYVDGSPWKMAVNSSLKAKVINNSLEPDLQPSTLDFGLNNFHIHVTYGDKMVRASLSFKDGEKIANFVGSIAAEVEKFAPEAKEFSPLVKPVISLVLKKLAQKKSDDASSQEILFETDLEGKQIKINGKSLDETVAALSTDVLPLVMPAIMKLQGAAPEAKSPTPEIAAQPQKVEAPKPALEAAAQSDSKPDDKNKEIAKAAEKLKADDSQEAKKADKKEESDEDEGEE